MRKVITAATIPKLNTRLLLKALVEVRTSESFRKSLRHELSHGELPKDVSVPDSELIVPPQWLGGWFDDESTVTVEQLKAELARREHIPNKPEGSKLRRQKQQEGRHRGRRDR